VLIGSLGSLDAPFSSDECVRRLNSAPSANSYVGYVGDRGFELARYGRTAVRIRGAFTRIPMGTRVDYRIEFIPWILWALAASYAVGVPILVGLLLFGYLPSSALALVTGITVAGLAINAWFSELQARWLKDYVTSALDLQ
jgi:hypothetical protein